MSTIQDKIVRIRKDHQCFSCLRKFEKGTEMRYWAGYMMVTSAHLIAVHHVYKLSTNQILMGKYQKAFFMNFMTGMAKHPKNILKVRNNF